jgi:tRNA(Ile)-lysidine synthetase-like protein
MDATTSIPPIERTLRQRLIASFRRSFPAPPARILVGFSGGSDSLALSILLAGTRPVLEVEIVLVHVDHRMRPESGADAEAARELAKAINLPIEVLRSEAEPHALFAGVGPEEAARRVRYQMLVTQAGATDAIAMAHHAGDQAETVLLHLIRGSGADGLAGMPELREAQFPWWHTGTETVSMRIWRPLLGESKRDLTALVAANGIEANEDPSNLDLTYRRNVIRHRLLPVLRDIEPTIETRLGNLSRIAAEESDYLDAVAVEIIESSEIREFLPRSAIDHAHPAIARRLIRLWLSASHGFEPSFDRVEAVRNLSKRNHGGTNVQLGNNLVAWIDRTHVRVGRKDSDPGIVI